MSARLQGAGLQAIAHRTQGSRHGPIVRLMSPSDLGRRLKPFVFLDYFDVVAGKADGFGLHPHSGIATVSVLLEGHADFEDTDGRTGVLQVGGLEWMRAGGGAWHAGGGSTASRVRGYQLWLALPPTLESGAAESRYLAPADVPHVGPVQVLLGRYEMVRAAIETPGPLNYLLVRLAEGEQWTYVAPPDHDVVWLALARGALQIEGEVIENGECVVFQRDRTSLIFTASADAEFVLGSAASHPHDLVLGRHSVHTSSAALAAGEQHINRIGRTLQQAGRLR